MPRVHKHCRSSTLTLGALTLCLSLYATLPASAQVMDFDTDLECLPPAFPCLPPLAGQWEGPYNLGLSILAGEPEDTFNEIAHAFVLPPGGVPSSAFQSFVPDQWAGQVVFMNRTGPAFMVTMAPWPTYKTFVWNPNRPTSIVEKWTVPVPTGKETHNPFCSAHVNLPNGDMLAVGGAGPDLGLPTPSGSDLAWLLRIDGLNEPYWQVHQFAMAYLRFYPTATLQPNGDVAVFGEYVIATAIEREVFQNAWNSTSGTYDEFGFDGTTLTNLLVPTPCDNLNVRDYPKMIVVEDGRTMWVDGVTALGPTGNHVSYFADLLDTAGPFPCASPVDNPEFRQGVIDPNSEDDPPLYAGNVVHLITQDDPLNLFVGITQTVYHMAGTTWGQDDQECPCAGEPASRKVKKMIDPSETSDWVSFKEGGVPVPGDPPHLNWTRVNSGGVVLPDGSIVVMGGYRKPIASKQPCIGACNPAGGHIPPDPCDGDDPGETPACLPARRPERYKPPEVFHWLSNEVWTLMAPQAHVREYHSVWGVTEDGRVFSAGGVFFDPAEHDSRYSVEIWSPPYFFNGPRPEILNQPQNVVRYGDVYQLQVKSTGGLSIERVAILKNTSATHATDFQQTYVELRFDSAPVLLGGTTDTWVISIEFPTSTWIDPVSPPPPTDAWAIAPPGWYLLTAVDANDLPSESVWVQLLPVLMP